MRGGFTSNTQLATLQHIEGAEPRYEFYALMEGRRIPLNVDAICSCDAEAGLVALSLNSP